MRRETLWTLAGVAAVAGGFVDLIGPLLYPHMVEQAQLLTYVGIDLFLLLGMLGLQSATGQATGWAGLVGFVTAVGGVLLVRSSAANVLGPSTYAIASAVWAIGMAIWGLAQLRPRTPFRWAGQLWFFAVLVPLAPMMFGDRRPSHQHEAHALFALGFIVLGVQLVRVSRASGEDRPT
ncbi:hypothetical protein [uncultured Caulobacter sp.]|uniref:hypothetical protein n=1 Tax=uncultured Caulobacter sp. TaxID=158749 RepID=UPI00262B8BB5|nr:hypothetical protein [uncultured Caulobacter sp.]